MNTDFAQRGERMAAKVKQSGDEVSYLRDLAGLTMELAGDARMDRIRRRWRDVNSLRQPDRPPVWCKPVDCWPELLASDSLVCTEGLNRQLEGYFRRILVKRDIDDDTIVNPYFNIGMRFEPTPGNTWGLDIKHEQLDEQGAAWKYQPALETYEDFDRLQVPTYEYNEEATESHASQLHDILGDSMPIRIVPLPGYASQATLCRPATDLRGMEPLMMDMVLAPERVHQLMGIVLKGVMNFLDAVEDAGHIVPNTDEPMFMSDSINPDVAGDDYTLKDCWMAGNSQELDQVSPEMFEEFLLDYQKQVFARFGAVSYGCCENLTRKLDPVLAIPNLRIMVCSAWTDLEALVERVDRKHCIMWRHLASDVVCGDDTTSLKRKIDHDAAVLKGSSYQAVLRELQTLMGHPDRLHEWTAITKDAVSR